VVKSGAVKAGTKQPRSRRLSTVGTFLTVVIACAIGYVAWRFFPRSEPASGEGLAGSSGSAASIVSCVFPASFWTDQNGRKRPVADLTEIELQNIFWVSSKGQHGEKADFHARSPHESPADLSCVDLSNFHLQEADFQGAVLNGAHFVGADLSGANLTLADLTGAELSSIILDNARLESSDVTGATMFQASLKKADLKNVSGALDPSGAKLDLTGANLHRANLHGADFTGAVLVRAELTESDLDGETDLSLADLKGAIFEPANLPGTQRTFPATHLMLLTYSHDRRPLTLLRTGFHGDGYKDQERQITYALKHADALLEWNACLPWEDAAQLWQGDHYVTVVSNCVEASLNKLVFDLPFQYGMNPIRPLYIVGVLWLLCSIVYVVIIKTGKRSAIFLVGRRDYRDGRTVLRRARIAPRLVNATTVLPRLQEILWRENSLWRVALFFSLQSALNIGFQELELGRWLKLLTTREYDLKAEGWARSLSGTQSLLSLLMLALSIWGLFGQPFSS
jgi:uncharacterized protein YjbI with pentapeptide repeats